MSNKKVYEIVTDILSILNTYLTDPWATAGGVTRTWAHRDKPLTQAKYPRIKVVKGRKENDVISLGYSKQRTGLFNIFFYTKKDFKNTISGTDYKNESLCEWYAEHIEDTLDTYRDNISNTWGLKVADSEEPIFLRESGLYVMMITVRLFWFKIEG